MNQEAGARIVEKMMQQYGCLPAINDSRIIENFTVEAMATAIEQELNKSADYGFTKITLHMDLPDAAMLAKALRRRV